MDHHVDRSLTPGWQVALDKCTVYRIRLRRSLHRRHMESRDDHEDRRHPEGAAERAALAGPHDLDPAPQLLFRVTGGRLGLRPATEQPVGDAPAPNGRAPAGGTRRDRRLHRGRHELVDAGDERLGGAGACLVAEPQAQPEATVVLPDGSRAVIAREPQRGRSGPGCGGSSSTWDHRRSATRAPRSDRARPRLWSSSRASNERGEAIGSAAPT